MLPLRTKAMQVVAFCTHNYGTKVWAEDKLPRPPINIVAIISRGPYMEDAILEIKVKDIFWSKFVEAQLSMIGLKYKRRHARA